MAKLTFTSEDHARIAGAIRAAEAGTTGEIYAVFTRTSDGYGFVAATAALSLSLIAGLATALVALFLGVAVPALGLVVCQILAAAPARRRPVAGAGPAHGIRAARHRLGKVA